MLKVIGFKAHSYGYLDGLGVIYHVVHVKTNQLTECTKVTSSAWGRGMDLVTGDVALETD